MSELTNPRFASDLQLVALLADGIPLKKGARGDGVLAVQNALRDMGFNLRRYEMGGRARGGPDGSFGPQTETALRNFQAHASRFFPDVKIDGELGATTLVALDQLAPEPDHHAWSPGQPSRLPNPYWRGNQAKRLKFVVVKREHRTYLFKRDGTIDRIFPNATGQPGAETDSGFKVVAGKLDERDAASVGKNLWNDPTAFGVRILNLSWADGRSSGEELHGTNRPDQLGQNVSHGCVRHLNEDIIYMFEHASIGDLVAIVEWVDDPALGRPSATASVV